MRVPALRWCEGPDVYKAYYIRLVTSIVIANTRGDPFFLVACSGDGFTLLSKSVTICDRMTHAKGP